MTTKTQTKLTLKEVKALLENESVIVDELTTLDGLTYEVGFYSENKELNAIITRIHENYTISLDADHVESVLFEIIESSCTPNPYDSINVHWELENNKQEWLNNNKQLIVESLKESFTITTI